MKATELRIGNLVNRLGALTSITVISADHISTLLSGAVTINQIEPIPLTEEWLVRLGFSNGNKELSNCDLWDKHWIGEFEIQKTGTGWSFDPYRFDKVIWFQYVHQLQNLYFALTGKELEANP